MRAIGVGAGGHAKVVIEILRDSGEYQLAGLLDPRQELWSIKVAGVSVLGNDDLLPSLYNKGVKHAYIGLGSVGDSYPRKQIYSDLIRLGFEVVPVIHPTAVISSSAEIGKGPTIMAGVIVNASVRLGDNVVLNTGSIIEHDCVIGDHVHIATGAMLAGTVWVGEGAHVGIGACVRQNIRIGRNALVGAGSVVVKDVPDNTTVIGIPNHRHKVTGKGSRERSVAEDQQPS